jgi:hypothetical protein
MKPITIQYKGYVIEITDNPIDGKYDFIIKKDNKVIVQSPEGYYFQGDAEVNAKMFINSREHKF